MGVPLCTCNEQVNATAQISIEEITNKDNIVQKTSTRNLLNSPQVPEIKKASSSQLIMPQPLDDILPGIVKIKMKKKSSNKSNQSYL